MTGGSIKENLKKPSLPSDWSIKKLRELCSQIQDGTHFTPQYVEYGIPFYSVESVTARNFLVSKYVTQEAHDVMAKRCRPQRGDILMTRIGSLGDTAIVDWDHEASIYVSLALLRPGKAIDEAYLYAYTRSKAFVTEVESRSLPNAIPKKINLGDIGDVEIWVPDSLHEQQAIATALSDADGVVAGLERVIAKKRLIKQGAMQDLLTARRRLPGFSGEWEVKRLGDHVRFLKNGTHSRAQLSEHGPVKNLHYGDIHGALSIFLSPATKPMPTLDSVSAGRLDRLAAGDLVFVDASEDLAGVGTSVEITDLGSTEVVSGLHTIAARFDKSVLVDGFKAFLQFMPAFRSHLCQLAAGTKVLATNRSHIASAEIPLPRPDEQQAIAAVLSDMDSEIQTLESRLAKARAVKEGMMQNLLTGRVRLV